MEPCSICGAEHAPAAAGEPCLAACVRALAARVAALESPPVPTYSVDVDPRLVVSLGGSAGGAGAMK